MAKRFVRIGATIHAVSVAALTFACSDPSTSSHSTKLPPGNMIRPAVSMTAAELHRANPMDFVGRLHGAIIRDVLEVRRTYRLSFRSACELAAGVMVRESRYADIAPQLSADDRQLIRSTLLSSPFCSDGRRKSERTDANLRLTRNSANTGTVQDTIWLEIGSTADAMLDSIYAENDVATSANDLASRLSPFLNTSFGMDTVDAWAVQTTVATAQDSWDLWNPPNPSLLTGEVGFLEECDAGNAENSQYTVDDITYICLNEQWVMAANRQRPSNLGIIQVSLSPVAATVDCGLSNWRRAVIVGLADVEGAALGWKLAKWAFRFPGGGATFGVAAFGAAVGGFSGVALGWQAWEAYQC